MPGSIRASGMPETGAAAIAAPAARPRRTARWAQTFRAVLALGIIGVVIGAALFAPWVSPYDPNAIALDQTLAAPSAAHPFGTDQLGRDILSRVIWGAQVSLFVAACAVLLAGVAGSLVGVVAGYYGNLVDAVIMRCADVQFALPAVVLALVLVGVIGASMANLIIVLSLANWARFARVVRSEVLSLRQRDFVLLARLAGASSLRIMVYHLIPNVLTTVIVLLTLDIGLIVILEATLSFLGLGVQPPDASWGSLIADGREYLEQAWWITLFPGAALMATVLAGNMLGDIMRDRLSPTLGNRW